MPDHWHITEPIWQGVIFKRSAHLLLQFDYLGETTEGNLHLVQRLQRSGMVQVFGLSSLNDILTVPVEDLAKATQVSMCICA